MSEVKTHYRTCNICEAMCGLEIQYKEQEVLSIKGDTKDPFSRGHICPKAVALQDFYSDRERLRTPIRKTEKGWEEIGWETAFHEIATKFKEIQKKHGKDAVGIYLGNPNAHNFGNLIFLRHFFKALGSNNRYSSASADQLPHHVASNFMLGNGMLIPVPDIDRTDFMLIIGGNPMVSNGSMMTAPGIAKRIKAIQQRGGKVVVVDPRRTETAKKADEHIFIRPERDALLLLGMVYTLFDEGLVQLGHLETFLEELEIVEKAVRDFSPEEIEGVIGIQASKIRSLAGDMATASSAVCYSRMGASTQSFGGLCQWLTNVFNILTGNFDREGGAMFTLPAFDFVRINSKKGKPDSYGRYRSRVRGLPYYNSEFPVSTLAEEILTEGEGQIKAMITIAGNPVLSSPNGSRLETALEQLDSMVSVDIYRNETSRHADIILPPATGLETSHYDIVFHIFAVRNTAKYSSPLFEKDENQRYDWEILKALSSKLTGIPEDTSTPETVLDMALRRGLYGKEGMSLEKLSENPHGIDLGPLRPCLTERLQTQDNRIHLAPRLFVEDLSRLKKRFFQQAETQREYPFDMIGRRLLRSHNTWTQNSKRLVKGQNPCTLLLHPKDALNLGIQNKQKARVSSATGSIQIEVEISDEMMEGVVSIPQGWGHNKGKIQMSTASRQPGVSINDLTDARRVDVLTGNAAFNGVQVAIEAME